MKALIKQADDESAALAAELLDKGELVAFPTETVYGLGADAANDLAVASIFETKGRPQFNPLIAHIADLAWIEKFAEMTPVAKKLAENFLPGPLTMVMKRSENCPVSHLVCAGLDTVGVRFPVHAGAQTARSRKSRCRTIRRTLSRRSRRTCQTAGNRSVYFRQHRGFCVQPARIARRRQRDSCCNAAERLGRTDCFNDG